MTIYSYLAKETRETRVRVGERGANPMVVSGGKGGA